MKGRLKDLTIGLDGTQNITVSVLGDFREDFKKLKDEPVDVMIKKHRGLRSRDANAYAWLAQKLGIEVNQTHIGMFDAAQCIQVIQICNQERSHH